MSTAFCRRMLGGICLALLLLLCAPQAAAEGGLCTPVIAPLDGPGFVALEALNVAVTVSCAADGCAQVGEQRLHLVNRDEVAPATIRLGIAAPCEASISSLSVNNATLATDGQVHTITLAPRAKADVTATVTSTGPEGPVLAGEIKLADARRWGAVESGHVTLRLPASGSGPDQHISPLPDHRSVESAIWDWAGEAADIAWAALGPAMQRRLADAAQAGDGAQLAELLRSVGSTDSPLLAWRDIEPQVLAALHSAVEAAPGEPRPRLLLAETYLALADQRPDRQLNYLLLALQQLDAISDDALPADELAQRRSAILHQAALAAHASGDPASALAYLNRAAELAPDENIRQAQDELVLQWGLDLARQGQVAAAIAMLDELGQLPVARELARFAPPLEYARTRVTLEPSRRSATYEIALYEPVADAASEQITQALLAAASVPGVQVTDNAPGPNRREFAVVVSFADLGQLHQRQTQLVEALDVYGGLVTELVAAPWRGEVLAWGLTTLYWGQELGYTESTDTEAFLRVWQADADYASWWLVELRAQQPEADADVAAHELSLLALREQTALWESLPDNVQWTYELAHPAVSQSPQWRLSSGEQRELRYRQRWYDWQRAGRLGMGLGVALCALLALSVALRRRRARRTLA